MTTLEDIRLSDPIIKMKAYPTDSVAFAIKRALDVIVSAFLLLLLSPLLLLIALAIMLDSPGPAIFIQKRAGSKRERIGGQTAWVMKDFSVYKFRTMYKDSGESLHKDHIHNYIAGKVEQNSQNGNGWKVNHDPRVTRIGHVLRRTSLDELPQLFNVLKGEMSLVGPRPVPVYEFEEYSSDHRRRMAALPGITGLWQVSGRCAVPFEEQMRMDLEYVDSWSLLLDMKILLRTIPAVVSGEGAE
jgi:lipopolysaccharide/colanic/teichoic acid biosynthesis glycosyltransferase